MGNDGVSVPILLNNNNGQKFIAVEEHIFADNKLPLAPWYGPERNIYQQVEVKCLRHIFLASNIVVLIVVL